MFGLLVLNRFIAEDPTAGNGSATGAATAMAVNSVSKLVTNQLNDLADDYLKGVSLDVGVDSYEDKFGGDVVTTATVGLSKTLLNDRLTIAIGTETNVGNSQANTSAAAAGGFQSNFVLTYQLTDDGHYLLRAFRRPDYDILSAAGQFETGGGVTYQRKFK